MNYIVIGLAWIAAILGIPTLVWLVLTIRHHRDMIDALRNNIWAANDRIDSAFDDISAVRQRAATAIQLAEKAQGTADEAAKVVPTMESWEGYGFTLYPYKRPIADVVRGILRHFKLRVKSEAASAEKVIVYAPDPNEGMSPLFTGQIVNPAVVPPTPKRKRK